MWRALATDCASPAPGNANETTSSHQLSRRQVSSASCGSSFLHGQYNWDTKGLAHESGAQDLRTLGQANSGGRLIQKGDGISQRSDEEIEKSGPQTLRQSQARLRNQSQWVSCSAPLISATIPYLRLLGSGPCEPRRIQEQAFRIQGKYKFQSVGYRFRRGIVCVKLRGGNNKTCRRLTQRPDFSPRLSVSPTGTGSTDAARRVLLRTWPQQRRVVAVGRLVSLTPASTALATSDDGCRHATTKCPKYNVFCNSTASIAPATGSQRTPHRGYSVNMSRAELCIGTQTQVYGTFNCHLQHLIQIIPTASAAGPDGRDGTFAALR